MAYPLSITYKSPEKSSRFLALITIIPIKVVLLIPIIVLCYIYYLITIIVSGFGILAVLIWGRYPHRFENIVIGFLRFCWRLMAYLSCMTDKYPPFGLKSVDYEAELTFEHQPASSRLWALLTVIPVKFVLLIPHMIIMWILGLVASICMLLGEFAVLILGRYREGFAKAITTYTQYHMQIMVYVMCLTDKY